MGLSFVPKREEDLRTIDLAPEGEYDFDILESVHHRSPSGNESIKLKVGLYSDDGRVKWHIYDYLTPLFESKFRHFCDSTGLLGKYESGSLEAADCNGRSGKAKVGIEKAKGDYPPKNTIRDYVCRKAKPLKETAESPKTEDGWEPPF